MMVFAKAWYKSKTVWVNVLGGVIVILEYLGTIGLGEGLIAAALVVANILLRALTERPISLFGKTKSVE